jgi:LCP family protein required for cell wall assembly
LLGFILMSVSAGTLAYWLVSSRPAREAAGAALTGGVSPARAFPGRDSVNILLLGRDEDRNRRGQVIDTRGRTDAILLAHVDFRERRVGMLSIPRDTLVRIPGYRGRHKINAANQYGGPELVAQVVENLTGVSPDAYVLVDYRVFARLVDEAGGVMVEVDKELNYDDNWGNLHIHLKPGLQKLNGEQALGLVRFRKSNDGHGDTDQERIARQQRLLHSLAAHLARPSSLMKLPRLLAIATEESQTNLSTGQALCLASFVRSVGTENIRMEVLPATPTRSALRVDEPAARRVIEEIFFAPPAPSGSGEG